MMQFICINVFDIFLINSHLALKIAHVLTLLLDKMNNVLILSRNGFVFHAIS